MAQLVQAFDATGIDPTQTSGGLPIGKHPVVIVESEIKTTKAGDGGMLALTLRVMQGPNEGTTGTWNLNIYNPNEQAKQIANRQLSAICHVIGVYQIQDSSQLHGHPFIIEVAPQKKEPQYTEVVKVYDMQGNEPGKSGQQAAQTAPQQAAPGAWGQPPAQQQQMPPASAQQPPAQAAPAQAWGQPPQQPPAQQGGQQWGQPPAGQQQAAPQQQQAPAQQQWGQPAQGQAPAAGAAPAWAQQPR